MSRRPASAGFSLVEVVVALTLVSLVMLALVAALRAFGDAGARLQTRIDRADDMRLVSGFLRQILAEASVKHVRRLPGGAGAAFFEGDARSLEWLAPMPARHGVGGLHHLRLSLQGQDDEKRLSLQFVPFHAAGDPAIDWNAEPARVLVEDVSDFAIQYQRLGSTTWLPVWRDSAVLPGRVRLALAADGGAWPDLVVGILAAEEGQDAFAEGFD